MTLLLQRPTPAGKLGHRQMDATSPNAALGMDQHFAAPHDAQSIQRSDDQRGLPYPVSHGLSTFAISSLQLLSNCSNSKSLTALFSSLAFDRLLSSILTFLKRPLVPELTCVGTKYPHFQVALVASRLIRSCKASRVCQKPAYPCRYVDVSLTALKMFHIHFCFEPDSELGLRRGELKKSERHDGGDIVLL